MPRKSRVNAIYGHLEDVPRRYGDHAHGKGRRGGNNVRDEGRMRELRHWITRQFERRDDLFVRVHILQGMLHERSWWYLP
jgi:hypothetical protein